jgi:hypothetical protein
MRTLEIQRLHGGLAIVTDRVLPGMTCLGASSSKRLGYLRTGNPACSRKRMP